MKFRLVGKDFQSWKTFDLNVGGFTVIVGASNRGKSALIRALKGILRNQINDAHIRKGEKSTEVTLVVDKGPTAVLTRTKTTAYKVNGEDFAKLSGELPDPLKALNLHAIQVGGTKLDPVFAGQFDSQFMMDLTPADLNNVLGLFSNTEQLNHGKKQINLSNTDINSQAKMLALEIQAGHTRVARMQQIAKEFGRLRPQHDEAQQSLRWARVGTTLLVTRRALVQTIKRYRKATEIALPSLEKVEGWFAMGKQLRQVQKARILVQTGKQIKGTPTTEAVAKVFTKVAALLAYATLHKRLQAKPKDVKINPKWDPIQQTRQALWDFKLIRTRIGEQELSIFANDKTLKAMHKELHDLSKDTITCPECGYQFTEDSDGN